MRKISSMFVLLFLFFNTFSQQTGDFSVGFPSPDSLLTRDSLYIYFHVPASYQPTTPSKMIVGIHGLGNPQTPEQIRNYFAPTGDSINAIVMCPAPYLQDQPRSKLVVDIAIDSALSWYNIDTAAIYLSGYSAGSDVAAQYDLDNPKHVMKGLIWYAPGFFYQPNLSAQTYFPPTCLCYGDADLISNILGQVDAILDSFQISPFKYFYNEIPGVAHTMEFPGFTKEMLECFRFIDDPENFVPDSLLSSVMNDAVNSETFSVFPNPTSGKIVMSWKDLSIPSKLRIIDSYGKIRKETDISSLRKTQYLDLEDLPSGVYFILASSANGNNAKRLVLSKE